MGLHLYKSRFSCQSPRLNQILFMKSFNQSLTVSPELISSYVLDLPTTESIQERYDKCTVDDNITNCIYQ